ncbi:hypothetical protein VZ94_11375 [Methylocucumis oryzae]|uniref:DUF4129 domain-containing protein n=2 Tax=Methylocucumis oryzae TaxID=1632867 RepID=A0A0F3IIN5_9GAMM|nr:hypothetical protein VZ94_11375 [Methylocucumis oryzae]
MIIGLSMSLYLNVIVVENKSGFAALKTSHSLVWGHWWRTLTVFMAPGLVFIILYAAILSAVLLFQYLGLNELDWLVSIIANLLSALIAPYFLGLGYVQYHDLNVAQNRCRFSSALGGLMSINCWQPLVLLSVLLAAQSVATQQQSHASLMELTVTRSNPLNSEGLAELLASVTTINSDADKPWDALKALLAWLKSLNPEHYEAHYQWLKWLWQALTPSAEMKTLIVNGLIVLLVLAVVITIGWLSRQAGWWHKRVVTRPSRITLPSIYATELITADINTLTPKQHIYCLLMQYRQALIRQYHLPNNNALTHRELLRLLTQPTLSRHFKDLLDVSEPILYGKQLVSLAELETFKQYYSHLTRAGS